MGDVTTLKDIRLSVFGYPGWEASNSGKIYLYGEEISGYYNRGYIRVNAFLTRATLVCTAWHGPKPLDKDVCAHKNDIKDDDRPENLYWATFSENAFDAFNNKVRVYNEPDVKGEKHGLHKLSDDDVIKIRELHSSGEYNQTQLASIFGVHLMTVSRIVRRINWRHI